MPNKQDFNALVAAALKQAGSTSLEPVIQKEILHSDILYALQSNGFLRRLTMQGGTSLRLLYGSQRYSEDLDFAGGRAFTQEMAEGMAECLETYIGQRYDLNVGMKSPRVHKGTSSSIKVDAWTISVETSPERRDLPRQKVKIEIANVTAHTRQLETIRKNHIDLPDTYSDILIAVETLPEIMADKIVSLPAVTSHVRSRDIWDLLWLSQNVSEPVNVDLVKAKVEEYQVEDFDVKLIDRINDLPDIVESKSFLDEMTRFLTPKTVEEKLQRSEFRAFMARKVSDLLQESYDNIYGMKDDPELTEDQSFRI